MWPLNLPARSFLRLPGATSTAWAVFDAAWYRAAYPGATAETSAEALLAFYLETGQGLGHAPNMLFDEAWHRRAYPAMAAVVQAGQFPSCFDAYCRGGCLGRSPHWLFDEVAYRHRYAELTDEALEKNGLVNGYDHYLWRGNAESRLAHPLFDPAVYLAQLDPAEAEAARADGPFWHCLRRLHQRGPEVRTSAYFDPAWYLDRYPEVAEAIARGTWRWALEHYLCNDTPTVFDPNPWFSESYYLARRQDAADMAGAGQLRSGFAHFLRHGVHELTSPGEAIDLAWYANHDIVRADLQQGLAPDAFTHWLTIGPTRGLLAAPLPDEPMTEGQAKELFRRRASVMAMLSGRTPLQFGPTGAAAFSVIMVLHNQFELTLMTLASLRSNYAGDIELILVDSGSSDETRSIEHYIKGVRCLRFDSNIGYTRGCNAALVFVTTDAVLYLNNDLELAPGAIAAALLRLKNDPQVGAVGGMIIRTHGVLQEAGCIVWRDGSTQEYMRDASPLTPEANFVRDVDFCSGAFLMTRRALLFELKGFDDAFVPAYYEDVDLCLRMAAAGYRVVYDPAVVLCHLEYGSANSSRAAEGEISRARQVFVRKHADYLERRPIRDERMQVFARMADTARKRVLFFEDTVPLRRIGSGFVRSNDLLLLMASMGYEVTVYPLNGNPFDLAAVYVDMPDNVEVVHDGSLDRLQSFLMQRRGYYDVVWIARTHNLKSVRGMLEHAHAGSDSMPRMVLDTEAIASVRDAGQAALEGCGFDLPAAIGHELADARCCEAIVAVTEAEAAAIRGVGLRNVTVIGHIHPLRPTPRRFTQRGGMLFVGAIHRQDSPNYESLCWFIDEVIPLVEKELGWETRLTIAGFIGAEVNLDRFRDHPRVTLRGPVPDLAPLYDSHRVFVAPTRFAAGTPYKVSEAASFGLPVVATEVLRQQLGWENCLELLVAEGTDPIGFARQVVALHIDESLWQRVRNAALERVRRESDRNTCADSLATVLGQPIVGGTRRITTKL